MKPETIEIDLLFEAIFLQYGYDFRQYSRRTAERRLLQRVQLNGLSSISELQHQVLSDPEVADVVLKDLSINYTEMFRDPLIFKAIREKIFPDLAARQHMKIWHAGCASGEEVYSMAIMLSESGLYDKSCLYATDFNNKVLDTASQGILPLRGMRKNSLNYVESGGAGAFSDYYYSNYESAVLDANLKRNMVFAHHNLVSGASFGEMQMIVCRNVLIYFNYELQEEVLQMFCDSLCVGGFLCLGSHETLNFSHVADNFENVSARQRLYRKVR